MPDGISQLIDARLSASGCLTWLVVPPRRRLVLPTGTPTRNPAAHRAARNAESPAVAGLPLHRGARIRTEDLLLPKQARYQAAPRPAATEYTVRSGSRLPS